MSSIDHPLKLFETHLSITVGVGHPDQFSQVLRAKVNLQHCESAAELGKVEKPVSVSVEALENTDDVVDALSCERCFEVASELLDFLTPLLP